MDARVPALLLLVSLLAGCSDGGKPPAASDDTFDDLDVEATDTTGIIRGVVVDDRIAPIASVEIGLGGSGLEARSATTDDEGRFVFDNLLPGTYLLSAKHGLYTEAQTSVDVVAGVDDPPIAKIQLVRRFAQEAFHEALKHDGFIQCNQSGVYYASAPCVTDFTGAVAQNIPDDQQPCAVPDMVCCKDAGCLPFLRTVQSENRGFSVTLSPGWQTLVWELVWKETSETFSQMGVTVSYNVTERCACHNYASVGGESPVRFQIDLGVDHPDSNPNEPELIPPEGLPSMYYFVGVREGPAVAVNQAFQLFATFFYYGVPPEGWSFVNEDPYPF